MLDDVFYNKKKYKKKLITKSCDATSKQQNVERKATSI